MSFRVDDILCGRAVSAHLPEHQTFVIKGCCGGRDLAAWRQRRAAKTNKAALADIMLETEFEEPRRHRRHKRVKGNGSGRESCSNLYHAAAVSGVNFSQKNPKRRVRIRQLPRLQAAAFSNSVVSVACDPAAGAAWKALEDPRAVIRDQSRCDLIWRARICSTVSVHSPPSTERGSLPARVNAVDHLARSLRKRNGLFLPYTVTELTARARGCTRLLPFLADAAAVENSVRAANQRLASGFRDDEQKISPRNKPQS